MPAAQIPVVRPSGPMSIVEVDARLRRCALAMRGYGLVDQDALGREAAAELRLGHEQLLLDVDRLLDVRLAIMVDGEVRV